MKKFLSLILSFSIIFTSISSVSAMDMELPKSLDSFTEDVSNLINEYNETKSYEDTVFLLLRIHPKTRAFTTPTG